MNDNKNLYIYIQTNNTSKIETILDKNYIVTRKDAWNFVLACTHKNEYVINFFLNNKKFQKIAKEDKNDPSSMLYTCYINCLVGNDIELLNKLLKDECLKIENASLSKRICAHLDVLMTEINNDIICYLFKDLKIQHSPDFKSAYQKLDTYKQEIVQEYIEKINMLELLNKELICTNKTNVSIKKI